MRLRKKQKEAVLSWIAEGLSSGEINIRASTFNPPLQVTRQNVDKYRKTRAVDIKAISKVDETNALTQGYALKEHRVLKLSQLAELLAVDIFGGFLWTEQVKGVGAGTAAEVVDYDEFNKAEVEAYRGVLDDIASETGGRIKRIEATGKDGTPLIQPEQMKPSEIAERVAALLKKNDTNSG
jgi:hypothetical protein